MLTNGPDERLDALRLEYLRLTRDALPAAAESAEDLGEHWPIRLDHCFMRVVLDTLFGQPWHVVLDRRSGPAFRQLDEKQIRSAIKIAERMLQLGKSEVGMLNAESLKFRR